MNKSLRGILIKTPEEIAGIRKAASLTGAVLDMIGDHIKVWISTEELDHIANRFILANGGKSACIGYLGNNKWWTWWYPKYNCISLNDVICHGIPSKHEILKDGDIFNVDVTVIVDGYFGDASRMYTVGTIDPKAKKIIEVTKKCLDIGISEVRPGNYTGNIGFEIAKYAEANGYSVVREYTGHGCGVLFHEDEPIIYHKAQKNTGHKMVPGMTFTIEPMINMGGYKTVLDEDDGWTVRTKDGSLSAQFEHTILVTETGCEVLTATKKFR